MVLTILPDLEAIIGDHLRGHDAIVALDARVAGKIPRSFTRPWVRITQLDATNTARSANALDETLVDYLLQLDVWAGSDSSFAQAQASELARTARAVLVAMAGGTFAGVVVTDVRIVSMARVPDLDLEPPRERVVLVAQVVAHAA
jgi:hypothetical protein